MQTIGWLLVIWIVIGGLSVVINAIWIVCKPVIKWIISDQEQKIKIYSDELGGIYQNYMLCISEDAVNHWYYGLIQKYPILLITILWPVNAMHQTKYLRYIVEAVVKTCE